MPLSLYALIILCQLGTPIQLGDCKAKGTQGSLCIAMATGLAYEANYEAYYVIRVDNNDDRLCMFLAKDTGV